MVYTLVKILFSMKVEFTLLRMKQWVEKSNACLPMQMYSGSFCVLIVKLPQRALVLDFSVPDGA